MVERDSRNRPAPRPANYFQHLKSKSGRLPGLPNRSVSVLINHRKTMSKHTGLNDEFYCKYAEFLGTLAKDGLLNELIKIKEEKNTLLRVRSSYQKHLDRLPITVDSLSQERDGLNRETFALRMLDRQMQMIMNLLSQT
jgi:hypothetical protein